MSGKGGAGLKLNEKMAVQVVESLSRFTATRPRELTFIRD